MQVSLLRGALLRTALAVGAASTTIPVDAAGLFMPDSLFLQGGITDHADSLTVGLTWGWSWHRQVGRGELTGYWDASIGRWRSDGIDGSSTVWVTQLGLTPVVRWRPGSWSDRWWLEAGIGLNGLVPIYRSGGKRFSTVFNFGDHLAIVHQFGVARTEEVSLRLQHYSNGGIREPNPGENFVQLRYAHRF